MTKYNAVAIVCKEGEEDKANEAFSESYMKYSSRKFLVKREDDILSEIKSHATSKGFRVTTFKRLDAKDKDEAKKMVVLLTPHSEGEAVVVRILPSFDIAKDPEPGEGGEALIAIMVGFGLAAALGSIVGAR